MIWFPSSFMFLFSGQLLQEASIVMIEAFFVSHVLGIANQIR